MNNFFQFVKNGGNPINRRPYFLWNRLNDDGAKLVFLCPSTSQASSSPQNKGNKEVCRACLSLLKFAHNRHWSVPTTRPGIVGFLFLTSFYHDNSYGEKKCLKNKIGHCLKTFAYIYLLVFSPFHFYTIWSSPMGSWKFCETIIKRAWPKGVDVHCRPILVW